MIRKRQLIKIADCPNNVVECEVEVLQHETVRDFITDILIYHKPNSYMGVGYFVVANSIDTMDKLTMMAEYNKYRLNIADDCIKYLDSEVLRARVRRDNVNSFSAPVKADYVIEIKV